MDPLDLWHQRTWELPPPGGFEIGTDGGTWVIEGRLRGSYQVVVRNASSTGSLAGIVDAFFTTAKFHRLSP